MQRENRRKERKQEHDYCVPVLAYFMSLSLYRYPGNSMHTANFSLIHEKNNKRKQTGQPTYRFLFTHSLIQFVSLGPQVLSLLGLNLLIFVFILLLLFSSYFPSWIYGGEI